MTKMSNAVQDLKQTERGLKAELVKKKEKKSNLDTQRKHAPLEHARSQ
jgi:hypothetical protein